MVLGECLCSRPDDRRAGAASRNVGTYNVRVQCFGEVNNAMGFMRGSLTVFVTST